MRAKFRCNMVEDYGEHQKTAHLSPVMDDGIEENKRFNQATPSGELKIVVTNPATMNYLKVGKSYYLDFSEADN